MGKLFKDLEDEAQPDLIDKAAPKEVLPVDSISDLKNKLSLVIDKVKSLKDEKTRLEAKVEELEGLLKSKEDELIEASSDKINIKDQISELLDELEAIETS